MAPHHLSAEAKRLRDCREKGAPWKRWGPYISERAWGTVREDYSPDGDAWSFLTHDMARSKAFRWSEEAIGGICDDQQILCFAPAFWNGVDPILKERLFGLSGHEGNHGEDVKELYFYLDATPTHSWLHMLYKYPQRRFPYELLRTENARRTRQMPEYEVSDTGIFDDGRYFDIDIKYAQADPEDICILLTITNRSAGPATIHVLPQLWFRNTWSWRPTDTNARPAITRLGATSNVALQASQPALGLRYLYAEGTPELLFTENDTNYQRLYGIANARPQVKDAINDYIVQGTTVGLAPDERGSKAALHYVLNVDPRRPAQIRLRLANVPIDEPFADFSRIIRTRHREADAFYNGIHASALSADQRNIQRQALAGMIWSQQFYNYDVYAWLNGDNPAAPPPAPRLEGRNHSWRELSVQDVMSMPDKWEYPWFAAWDLAFHAIPLAMVDMDSAKQQLELLIGEKLMHPNGQIPAYEWQFSDVNPPVQAWAVWRVYNMDKHANQEKGDIAFLERCYHKLLMNFTWWVNRKDRDGRNIFEGGFLGLDNISVTDRSQPLAGGGRIEQADSTGWMALFCLNLMAIGLELAQKDRVYEHLGAKFFEHFMYISAAINQPAAGGTNMWDETDGWYYDVIHQTRNGIDSAHPLPIRSLVGMVPLFAAQVLEHHWFANLPHFRERYEWLLMNRPEFTGGIACIWTPDGHKCLLSIASDDRLKRILSRILDEAEFLAPHGIRSLSRYHLEHPYTLSREGDDQAWSIGYEPGESAGTLFGGNSNWRGPIWFPTAFMLVTALRVYDRFYGESMRIECPARSGHMLTLNEVAMEIARRLCSLFQPTPNGTRPSLTTPLFTRPEFRNLLLFHEYFNGDTGQGLGASHQTGWTGLVAKLLDQLAHSGGAA